MQRVLLPEGWPRPKGYSNGISADAGELIFCGGQIGWTPEGVFDRRWAMTVLDRALDRLGATEDPKQFEQLKPYMTSAGQQAPYRQVAETLEMSEGAVKTAVHRLRKRFGECLRAEIAETVADPVEVDDEVRHLLAVVRRQ